MTPITEENVEKLCGYIDAGLVAGDGGHQVGNLTAIGAVNKALGGIIYDTPKSVGIFDAKLLDALSCMKWGSCENRASGMKRLCVSVLGSVDHFGWSERLATIRHAFVTKVLPGVLRAHQAEEADRNFRASILIGNLAIICERFPNVEQVLQACTDGYGYFDKYSPAKLALGYLVNSYAYKPVFDLSLWSEVSDSKEINMQERAALQVAYAIAQASRLNCSPQSSVEPTLLANNVERVVEVYADLKTAGSKLLHLTERAPTHSM